MISRNSLALDLNAFYMLHNIDARTKENTNVDIAPFVDRILDQKIGQLDDLIQKQQKDQIIHVLPKIITNGLEMEDTDEIKRDNELLSQIVINTAETKSLFEISENEIKTSDRKLLGTKSIKHFYESESEEEEEESSSLEEEEIEQIENQNLHINTSYNKTYKINNIKYKDRFWNELASIKLQNYTLDILFINGDINLDELKRIETNYHGIMAYTIQNECADIFQNAKVYEGEYYDILMNDLGINLDQLINIPNVKANINMTDKKWKILKFKCDRNYERLIRKPRDVRRINWPKFEFEELNINFDAQINDA